MKLLSVLLCACVLLDAYTEIAANITNDGGNLRSVEMGANGNRILAGHGNSGKGKTNKMEKIASSKEGKGKGGKGGKAKSSKKSSKRMGKGGKGKGDVSMNPSSMPSQLPSTYPSAMPSKTPIAVSLDISNDAISIDEGAISADDESADDANNLSVDDGDRAGTTSPSGGIITIPTPTSAPTSATTKAPVVRLTKDPTRSPTVDTSAPTADTSAPTAAATKAPVVRLTKDPTRSPTVDLSDRTDTIGPSLIQLALPTVEPTLIPTKTPTIAPTKAPVSLAPTKTPTGRPTETPTGTPTKTPTSPAPTGSPTSKPTKTPTPTASPTMRPVVTVPTKAPATPRPTPSPTSKSPTVTPTKAPTSSPTVLDRAGDDDNGTPLIPLISILQGRLEPNSYYGGVEFENPNSYQYKALQRIEEQDDSESLSNHKLIQYYVLYCIYFSAGGSGWVDADGWTRNDLPPCGGFFGVACNDDNAIVGINLYDNGLSGQFPPEITLLASDGYRSTGAGRLRSLDLYLNVNLGNGNESRWVSELGSGLKYLFIGKTGFGGSLPKLPSGLIEFDASHTNINGGLIASNFEDLDHLTWLLLDGCEFQTSIPTEFAQLPKLEYFYISDSQITGDLSYLEGMPVLFEHFASNNPNLGGELYSFIGDIQTLASLNLAGNGLEGSIPASFGNLDNLRQLWLNDNNLSGQIPPELSELIALETLELQGNNLAGDFPPAICDLKDPGYSLKKLGADCSVHKCECCDCCTTEFCQAL